jgi:hypothetical protein
MAIWLTITSSLPHWFPKQKGKTPVLISHHRQGMLQMDQVNSLRLPLLLLARMRGQHPSLTKRERIQWI